MSAGYVQSEYGGFDYNGESNLDLQYSMTLVGPTQPVTLYQAGDMVEGVPAAICMIVEADIPVIRSGASFNNLLDALDASYCTFEGGDNPDYDSIYPDPYGGGYEGSHLALRLPPD